jgi:serine protease Do
MGKYWRKVFYLLLWSGALIVSVVEGSPASKAGLQAQDIITDFDGQRIKGEDDKTLQKLIAGKKVGDNIKIKIWRDGKILEKSILLTPVE